MFWVSFTVFALLCNYAVGGIQTIDVIGQVYCHDNEIGSEKETVQLWHYDWESQDDNLGSTTTGVNGTFILMGSDDELLSLDPHVVVFAKCEEPMVHLMIRPLAKRCSFVVTKKLNHQGDKSKHGISMIVDMTKAEITCT